MEINFTEGAYEDYKYWESNDNKIFIKINRLVNNIKITPFRGLGKPEPLKKNLSGYWSRRITHEHRLVYKVTGKKGEQILTIILCRYHY